MIVTGRKPTYWKWYDRSPCSYLSRKEAPESPHKNYQNTTRADTTCSAVTVADTGEEKSMVEYPSEFTLPVRPKVKDQQGWLVVGRVRGKSQMER